jgi:hypothetical protein
LIKFSGKKWEPLLKILRSYYPWSYFFPFLIANLFLSYVDLSPYFKVGVFTLGVLAPLIIGLALIQKEPLTPWFNDEPVIRPSLSILLILFSIAIFIRFYHLTSFSIWPLTDEGLESYFSIETGEKWVWNSSHDFLRFPLLYDWLQGFLFKYMGPSLLTLWLFPALISVVTFIAAYFCFALFVSSSLAWIATFLVAFSFWPMYLSRFSTHSVPIPLWIFITLLPLGYFLKETSLSRKRQQAALLGLLIGIGFYIYISWFSVAFVLSLFFMSQYFKKRNRDLIGSSLFIFFLLLPFVPIVASLLHKRDGSYINSLWFFKEDMSWPDQFSIWTQYLTSLFWGVHTDLFAYKPYWGGLLNPILGACFGLGFLEISSNDKTRWLIGALLVLLLPGLLTHELEINRLVQILPILIFFAAIGIQSILAHIVTPQRKIFCLYLLLIPSFFLDSFHLFGIYQKEIHKNPESLGTEMRSIERWKAFQVLRKISDQNGPGWILLNFEINSWDQTLLLATYNFNAARNPHLTPEKSSWAGILTHLDYSPFLSRRFPESRWCVLCPDPLSSHSDLVLGIIPINDENRTTLTQWLKADQALNPMVSEYIHLPMDSSYRGNILLSLYGLRPLFQGDPFLESCLDEKIFMNEMAIHHPDRAFDALHRALTLGYPTVEIFNDLGVFWFSLGNRSKSIASFRMALKIPGNHAPPLENMKRMGIEP